MQKIDLFATPGSGTTDVEASPTSKSLHDLTPEEIEDIVSGREAARRQAGRRSGNIAVLGQMGRGSG